MKKTFEISQKDMENGKRKFKVVLCEVYPDSTIDAINEVGTKYNENGISFIESFVRERLDTVVGTFIRAEFLDDERVEINGHGYTDIVDNYPIFENAVTIGVFTNAYIEEVEESDGNHMYCIGEGEIDALCYHNFVDELMRKLDCGELVSGSVEICRLDSEPTIIYKYGWKDYGRIPSVFRFSGYALIGIPPSDKAAKLIELNQKEENADMNKDEVLALIAQAIEQVKGYIDEVLSKTAEYEQKIEECNATIGVLEQEKQDALNTAESAQAELESCKGELEAANARVGEVEAAKAELESALKAANEEKRIGELNSAIQDFSAEELEYANNEIEAFKSNPLEFEINSVVEKIFEGIGRNAKKNETAQQNSNKSLDIFGEINSAANNKGEDDDNIF